MAIFRQRPGKTRPGKTRPGKTPARRGVDAGMDPALVDAMLDLPLTDEPLRTPSEEAEEGDTWVETVPRSVERQAVENIPAAKRKVVKHRAVKRRAVKRRAVKRRAVTRRSGVPRQDSLSKAVDLPGPPPSADLELDEPMTLEADSGVRTRPQDSTVQRAGRQSNHLPASASGSARRAVPENIGGSRRTPGWLGFLLLLALPLAALLGYYLNRDPAVVLVSAELLDFEEQLLGSTQELTAEFSNQGQEALRIGDVQLAGADDASFRVALESHCSGRDIAQAETCRMRVQFTPQHEGVNKAQVLVHSNAINSPQTLPLIGIGTAPRMRLDPAELDFGTHTVGTASLPLTLEVINDGSVPLEMRYLELEGLESADFVILEEDCSQRTLEVAARCEVRLGFLPTAAGPRSAKIVLTSDGAATVGSTAMVDGAAMVSQAGLTGTGLAQVGELNLEPERLDFGAVLVGEKAAPQQVLLRNSGNGLLEIGSVEISSVALEQSTLRTLESVGESEAGESGATNFQVLSDTCSGKVLDAGSNCQLKIEFIPQREGDLRAFFEIAHGAAEEPYQLPVVGVGITPRLQLDPSPVRFGEVAMGKESSPRGLSLVSGGSAPLTLHRVLIEGADASAFSTDQPTCASAPIEPAQDCRLKIRFKPRRPGPHRAELVIRHSGAGGVERRPLNGLGVAARLSLDRERLDFGEVSLGREKQRALTLTNSGRAPLDIRRVRLVGQSSMDGFEVRLDRCTGARLGAGARCRLQIALRPTTAGARGLRLVIEHSAEGGTVEVPISATAVDASATP